jgi:hypothetical protein
MSDWNLSLALLACRSHAQYRLEYCSRRAVQSELQNTTDVGNWIPDAARRSLGGANATCAAHCRLQPKALGP